MINALPRIVSKKDLKEMVPYSSQHILRLEKAGRFPRRIQLGERRVGWRLTDIERWLEERVAASTTADRT